MMTRASTLLIVSILSLGLANCSSRRKAAETPPPAPVETTPPPIETPSQAAANPEPPPLVWGYSGEMGPENWSKLDGEFSVCKSGRRQSPIDLKWKKPVPGGDITFSYQPAAMVLKDTGHTLMVEVPPGSFATINGKNYELKNIQFHSASEHTLSGNSLPMEAHLFHKNDNGEMAMVSAILIEGQAHPTVQKIWDNWPAAKFQAAQSPDIQIQPMYFIPEIKTHYAYEGSLTTPPCTEGVSWIVFNTPIEVSKEQILAFRSHYPSNNRPLQPLNGRKVVNH